MGGRGRGSGASRGVTPNPTGLQGGLSLGKHSSWGLSGELVSLVCSASASASSSSSECGPGGRARVGVGGGLGPEIPDGPTLGGGLENQNRVRSHPDPSHPRRAAALIMKVICLGMSPNPGFGQPFQPLGGGGDDDSGPTPSSQPGRLLKGPGLPFRVKTRRKDVPEAPAGGKDAPSLLGPTSWVSRGPSLHRNPLWPPPQGGHGLLCLDALR